jgi:hypothetical protein
VSCLHRKELDNDDGLNYDNNHVRRHLIAPTLPHHNNLLMMTTADPYTAYVAMRLVAAFHQNQFMNPVPLSAVVMQQHASESDEMYGGHGC